MWVVSDRTVRRRAPCRVGGRASQSHACPRRPPPCRAGRSRTLPLLDRREARTPGQGHARQDDPRHLIAFDLNAYLDWLGVAQVFPLAPTWRVRDETNQEVRYGITSPSPTAGALARLLALQLTLGACERSAPRQGRDARRGCQPDPRRAGTDGDGAATRHCHQRAASRRRARSCPPPTPPQ